MRALTSELYTQLNDQLQCEPKKTYQNVLSYLLQNSVHSDKFWYALS